MVRRLFYAKNILRLLFDPLGNNIYRDMSKHQNHTKNILKSYSRLLQPFTVNYSQLRFNMSRLILTGERLVSKMCRPESTINHQMSPVLGKSPVKNWCENNRCDYNRTTKTSKCTKNGYKNDDVIVVSGDSSIRAKYSDLTG